MEGYVGDTPSSNPNLAPATDDGGYLAPDLTENRMDLNMTDSLASSDSSLINTKNEEPLRQDTLATMLSAPMTLPDGTPIREVRVDQLFDHVRVSEEEREHERRALIKRVTSPTLQLLMRFLEDHGGPDSIPINAKPPKKGFPPGVSVTALRAELGHNIWALRHVLYALPTFTIPIRKITEILNGMKKGHRKRPQFDKKRFLADATSTATNSKENTPTHHLFSLFQHATPKLSTGLRMIHTLLTHQKPPINPAFRHAAGLVTLLATTALEIEQSPEGLAWNYVLEKRVIPAFDPVFHYLNETVMPFPEYEELSSMISLVAPVLLGVAFIVIKTCNTPDPEETPSTSQPTATAGMVIELSNGVYNLVEKLAVLAKVDKIQAELAATILSTVVLLAGKELGGPSSFDGFSSRTLKRIAAARTFEHYTDTSSKEYKATSKLSRPLAALFEQYKIEMSKYEYQTPLAFLQCAELLLLPLIGLHGSDMLPRAARSIMEMLPEWYTLIDPMAEENTTTLFGTLSS
ncbi:hypothetical protein SCG7086_AN_00200 [Chlamydiales bacterium SCGC AG-110-P3]|nr:hypothetical protein SCG7086_AN_00200 [Chlamydiales bacterium SCGC AG-110-P3]